MTSDVELPDTSGYSYDHSVFPWERLDCEMQLRIFSNDRSAAIEHMINWIFYAEKVFSEHVDYYAGGAWVVISNGLACQRDGVATSDWVYDAPQQKLISYLLGRPGKPSEHERFNRALLKFPIATDMIVASKASWWCWERPLTHDDESLLKPLTGTLPIKDFVKVANVIGQWASTRKVLSSAGIKGMLEESDIFAGVAHTLRIRDELKPYFSHPPSGWNFPFRSLLDSRISLLLKYWPAAEEISSLLCELRDFHAGKGDYHKQSKFLTGRPRKVSKLNAFYEGINNIHELFLVDPNLPRFKNIFQKLLEEFDEDSLKDLVRYGKTRGMKEFLASKRATVTDDIVEAVMNYVNKMDA